MFNEEGMDWDLAVRQRDREWIVEKVLRPITIKRHASQAMSLLLIMIYEKLLGSGTDRLKWAAEKSR